MVEKAHPIAKARASEASAKFPNRKPAAYGGNCVQAELEQRTKVEQAIVECSEEHSSSMPVRGVQEKKNHKRQNQLNRNAISLFSTMLSIPRISSASSWNPVQSYAWPCSLRHAMRDAASRIATRTRSTAKPEQSSSKDPQLRNEGNSD